MVKISNFRLKKKKKNHLDETKIKKQHKFLTSTFNDLNNYFILFFMIIACYLSNNILFIFIKTLHTFVSFFSYLIIII